MPRTYALERMEFETVYLSVPTKRPRRPRRKVVLWGSLKGWQFGSAADQALQRQDRGVEAVLCDMRRDLARQLHFGSEEPVEVNGLANIVKAGTFRWPI